MRDERLRRYFKALGDKTRFDVVQQLSRMSESSVTDLCVILGVTQPLMSWHVRILRNAGIVTTRPFTEAIGWSADATIVRPL